MVDEEKSKEQLLAELASLRRQVANLEAQESVDLNARRHAEEAYRALVDYSLQGLAILGTDGILFANPAMAGILGYSVEELLSMSLEQFYDTIAPEHRPFMDRRLAAWRSGQQPSARFEIQVVRKDGERRWIERLGAPIEYQGQRVQQISIIDITERKEAETALQRHTFQLERLNQIIQAFTATLDIDQVLLLVVEGLQRLVGGLGCAIWLYERQQAELVCREVTEQWRQLMQGWRFKPGESLTGQVFQTGQSRIIPDVQVEERYRPEFERMCGVKLRSMLIVPVLGEGGVLGIIQLGDPRPGYFTPAHLRLVESLAAAVSIAIQNARLYRTAQQVDQLRLLHELDEALSQAILSPATVAEVTLRHVSAALAAPAGGLWLLSPRPDVDPDRFLTLASGWQTDEQGRGRARFEQYELGPVSAEVCRSLLGLTDDDPTGHQDMAGLFLPITSDGKLVAALLLASRSAGRPFTSRDQDLLRTIAGRVAQSFRSAQLYQASQARAAYLTTLHAISTTVVSSLDLNTVLRQVLELVCQALEATEGFILLLEQETQALLFAMTLTPKTAHLRGRRLSSDRSIVATVIRDGQPVRVGDVRRHSHFSADIDAVTGFETRSLICAPLTYRGQIIGVIEIVNNFPDKFSNDDLALVAAVASIAAAALQNAQLYAASQTRASELAILNEIGLALTSTLDYKTVVRLALSLSKGLFRAGRAVLFQVEPDKETLHLVSVQPPLLNETAGLPLEEKVAAWALANGQPALVTDLASDTRVAELEPGAGPEGAGAIMAMPLLVTGKPIGVLVVTRDYQEAYGLEDLRILQAVGSILAMALGKAQLYAEQVWLLRERERTQQQLVQTEKMVAMGRLVSAIMHEINNPLQAVQNFLGLAQEEVRGDRRQAELERYLSVVGAEVGRISNIIHNLRDFYSPASSEFQTIDINSIISSVLDLTGKQLERERIAVERLWDPALPKIDANAGQLRQVFLNLVLNAIDAMSGGGTLRVTTASGLLGPGQSGPGVRIEFSDTGKGMSPEVQSRLFEPFFTTKTDGSGLGLSISYSIIRAHRGQISVVSHPGLGTTVTILLPTQQPERGQIV